MHPTEIFPDLWIGDHTCIDNLIFLSENKFKCIINCSKDLHFNKNYTHSENIRLVIDDNNLFQNNIDMFNKIEDIIKYIHHYLSQNKSVLVYCNDGRQRSPTVVAAYIMKYGKVSAKQAVEYIRSKRPDVFEPRVNFYFTLQKLEKNL